MLPQRTTRCDAPPICLELVRRASTLWKSYMTASLSEFQVDEEVGVSCAQGNVNDPLGRRRTEPQYHVVVGVVSRVPEGHVLKVPTIGLNNIDFLGPHLPPLSHHRQCYMISISHSLSREEVCWDFFKPCRHHRCRNILVLSLLDRSIYIHIEVSHNNQLHRPWLIRHFRLHISSRCSVARPQVTYHDVPTPFLYRHMPRYYVLFELIYCLDWEGVGVLK